MKRIVLIAGATGLLGISVVVALSFKNDWFKGNDLVSGCVCQLASAGNPSVVPMQTAVIKVGNYADAWNQSSGSSWYNETPEAQNDRRKVQDGGSVIQPTCAVTISAQDMVLAFGMQCDGSGKVSFQREHIRAYTGIDNQRLHLYFVPVINDVDEPFACADGETYVLDLTTPCPNTCDTNSTLYQTFVNHLDPSRRQSFPTQGAPHETYPCAEL